MEYMFELYKSLLSHHLILGYTGEFTPEITKSILHNVEQNLETTMEDVHVKRKVFNVMVECLQNIGKHTEELNEVEKKEIPPVFMIGEHKNEYIIIGGNLIHNDGVAPLKKRLDQVNALDKEGLKEIYQEIISSNQLS
ncbi:SiaB family protein kinase, partial [Xanthovirga aplysinae]|uniref:SiaB family protein kinase n=1 Tax=Xanthovirga aplysinae TaxID=2529853 RepID=UPI0012BD7963